MISPNTFTRFLTTATLLVCASLFVPMLHAKHNPPQSAAPQAGNVARPSRAGNVKQPPILRLLNLSMEQRAQIRRIRQETEPVRRTLIARLRAAQRELDAAIYSDDASEEIIVERATAVATAQGELTRRRAVTELYIRRILTAQQLETLRDLRAQARAQNSANGENANQSGGRRGRFRGRLR